MAYLITIDLYLMFAAAVLMAALFTHFVLWVRTLSLAFVYGLMGSAITFVATPPMAVFAGIIPDVMLQPEYFLRPFPGCIQPTAGFMLQVTSIFGVLIGFSAGFWLGLKRRRQQAAKACAA